jgi:hypothetical protein
MFNENLSQKRLPRRHDEHDEHDGNCQGAIAFSYVVFVVSLWFNILNQDTGCPTTAPMHSATRSTFVVDSPATLIRPEPTA